MVEKLLNTKMIIIITTTTTLLCVYVSWWTKSYSYRYWEWRELWLLYLCEGAWSCEWWMNPYLNGKDDDDWCFKNVFPECKSLNLKWIKIHDVSLFSFLWAISDIHACSPGDIDFSEFIFSRLACNSHCLEMGNFETESMLLLEWIVSPIPIQRGSWKENVIVHSKK